MSSSSFYYVTQATGEKFIRQYTQYALKSLLRTGIPPEDIHCPVNTKKDKKLLHQLVPEITNVKIIKESLSHVVWTYQKGKRKYSLFKAAAMAKAFPKPDPSKCLICFDGDVLWYKDPTEFLKTKMNKTWFHHGKDLQERCKYPKEKINPKKYASLKYWVDPAFAYLLIKYNVTKLPDREVVAGFYLLRPEDHDLLKITYKFCQKISKKFARGEGKDSAGEQKPLNAALCKLQIGWHGGSRFYCPEHKEYFDHYFGKKDMKAKFFKKVKKMRL